MQNPINMEFGTKMRRWFLEPGYLLSELNRKQKEKLFIVWTVATILLDFILFRVVAFQLVKHDFCIYSTSRYSWIECPYPYFGLRFVVEVLQPTMFLIMSWFILWKSGLTRKSTLLKDKEFLEQANFDSNVQQYYRELEKRDKKNYRADSEE